MRKLIAATISLLFLFSNSLLAQTTTVTGKVTNVNSEPVVNASVIVKGANRGTVADENGNFTIAASPTDTLQISSTGYVLIEIPINGNTNLIVTLESATGEL